MLKKTRPRLFRRYAIRHNYCKEVFAVPPVDVSCGQCGEKIGSIVQRNRGRASGSPHLLRPMTGDMISVGIVVCPFCTCEIRVNAIKMAEETVEELSFREEVEDAHS